MHCMCAYKMVVVLDNPDDKPLAYLSVQKKDEAASINLQKL